MNPTLPRTQTVNDAIADELKAIGTEAIFGLVGEDTVVLVTIAGDLGIEYYGARHENIAINMADGYAWKSGGLGVCTVTRGAGILNAATALRTAARAGRSVLCITGDMATNGDWDYDYKSIEHAPLVASIGAEYVAATTADEVLPAFRRAVALAESGRTVVFSVPADVLHGPAGADPPVALTPAQPTATPRPSAEQIERAVALLDAAERPLIIVGRGALADGVRAVLEQLAERTGALLGTTLLARESFAGSPHDVGVVGGYTREAVVPVLAEIDCVIAFGATLNFWTTGVRTLLTGSNVIQVDVDETQLGKNTRIDVGIHGDALETAVALVEAVSTKESKPFHEPDVLARLQRPLWVSADETTAEGLDPRVVTTALDTALPHERTIVQDAGRHSNAAARYMRFLSPRQFRHTSDGGAIGMGLGVALGAQAAAPGIPTVVFTGDGAASMALGDLETAVRNDLPVTIVVMNDAAYGSELVYLEAHGTKSDLGMLPPIDFAAVGASLGLETAVIAGESDLTEHLERLPGRRTPLLLDVRIRQDLFVGRASW